MWVGGGGVQAGDALDPPPEADGGTATAPPHHLAERVGEGHVWAPLSGRHEITSPRQGRGKT